MKLYMPNIKCPGLTVSEKKIFKLIVDRRTDGCKDTRAMDDGQTGTTIAHLRGAKKVIAKQRVTN